MNNNVLVFGASGFIGSHVVEALQQAGKNVTCIVRPDSDTRYLKSLDVTCKQVAHFDRNTLTEACTGFPVVYNCTADVRLHKPLSTYRKTQVELTAAIMRAAGQAGCRRFVQLSSIEVYGDMPAHMVDETFPCSPKFPFQQSLVERELLVKQLSSELGMEYVIVRPAATFGRRYRLLDFLLSAYQEGRFPVIGGGGHTMSMVDTRDIGRAMVIVGDNNAAANATFHVCGYQGNMRDIRDCMDNITGQETRLQNLPVLIANALALALELLLPYSKTPFLTRFAVHATAKQKLFSDARIRKLGYREKYTIKDTFSYILAGNVAHGINDYEQSTKPI